MALFERKPFAKKQEHSVPPQPKTEEIAKLAYDLYLQRGEGHGQDQEDWFQAEALIRQRRN